ncbi:hypothetical protein F0562_028449 [Nyssa sinensis]|uniref:DUF632 domain-containing protein n=1 Tax=Nyssa sinensis TaxID=561372 RepID=A0A5J5B4B9_9ASTE|nr:hypothetical protein F0562_028449 [Nyssa sinensis]
MAAINDLYSRILVALSAKSISRRIEKLKEEELQPHIVGLLQGLMRTWKITLESLEIQNKIMFESEILYTCPTYGKSCNNTHRFVTLQLEAKLQDWRACFREYIAAQKAYIEALCGWLSKFVVTEVEFILGAGVQPHQVRQLFSMKTFAKDVKAFWLQEEEERQQKRKVDS